MKKKVTVKDVAREAGVSVATVSYIMNNRTDQKISDATRTKVLQIANLLEYRPNQAAISLATGRTNIIGVSYCLDSNTPSRNHEILYFVNLLIERLNRMQYDILFLPISGEADAVRANPNIDAVIAIGLSHQQFKMLSEKIFVPVISVDMLINDSLFFQIYSDYPALISKAWDILEKDAYLLYDGFGNDKLQEYAFGDIPKEQLLTYKSIKEKPAQYLAGKKLIVLGSYLALMILPYINPKDIVVISSEQDSLLPESVELIHNDIEKKANLTMNILLNALNHNFDLNHDCKVL